MWTHREVPVRYLVGFNISTIHIIVVIIIIVTSFAIIVTDTITGMEKRV